MMDDVQPTRHPYLARLSGGDRRSIGRANQVVDEVLRDPALLPIVFDGMLDPDPVVRMRAADAVEKITARRPAWLAPLKEALLRQVARIDQQEVRWHVAQMLPRLDLEPDERDAAIRLLESYLDDRSQIVKTFAMQALADLAADDDDLRPAIVALLARMVAGGSPAVKSRGQRLLEQLNRAGPVR